jgi:uncharacterized membrane protein (UPF0127 family)
MALIKTFSAFNESGKTFITAHIGDNNVRCELCSSHEDGLIGRRIEGDGMIFQFHNPQPLVFHTKGCIESIDIVFLLDGRIIKIESQCKPNSRNNFSCDRADTVLEFPAGTCNNLGIKIGDLVNF